MSAPQDEENIHYSSGIPSKTISEYEVLNNFNTFTKLKNYLTNNETT